MKALALKKRYLMESNTLVKAIRKARQQKTGVTFIDGAEDERILSYEELYEQALRVLGYLQQKGMKKGDELVFQLEDNKDFVIYFWACILGGIIPVPLSVGKSTDQKSKLVNVWKILNRPFLTAGESQYERIIAYLTLEGENSCMEEMEKRYIQTSLASGEKCPELFQPEPNDIAYIQFSSGSTSFPKGVTLTHENVLSNVMAILHGINHPPEGELFFSWMPLTHDMGLVGYHLTPLVAGWNHYIMPTDLFIRRPILWLKKISEHHLTFTASPNFGYRFLLNAITEDKLQGVDLSSLRIITNGAEPISADLCWEFVSKLAAYGLKANVIFPVYGLAEATLAVTFSSPGQAIRTITLNRSNLSMGESIKLSANGGITFVNVGKPVLYSRLRIKDHYGRDLQEGYIGNIEIKGKNVTNQYYNNPSASATLISEDGWLDTGDIGFLYEGDLFITGRRKDIIFVNGQNYYPYDIENTLVSLPEIEVGKVVVSGWYNPDLQKEEIIVFVLFKRSIDRFIPLAEKIRLCISNSYNIEINCVIPVREIPKTTSGKIQRFKLIQQYAEGTFVEVLKSMEQEFSGIIKNISPAPVNALENQLLEIWQKIFPYTSIGVEDNFFSLGGNSLKMALLLEKIEAELSVVLNFADVFENSTIREMALLLSGSVQRKQSISIIPAPENKWHPLSFTQKGIYYNWLLNKEKVTYNIPLALDLDGNCDAKRLETAIGNVIRHHPVFGSVYSDKSGTPMLSILPIPDFHLSIMKVKEEEVNATLYSLIQPFDLQQGPLYRFVLLELNNNKMVLFLDLHHIITDGISISLLLQNILLAYEGKLAAKPQIRYCDYIYWAQQQLPQMEQQGVYWRNILSGTLPLLELPLDNPRPALFSYDGRKICFQINTRLYTAAKQMAEEQGVSLFMLLFAAYNVMLAGYSGQEDIIVGVPVAGRRHPQLKEVIGMFVNNLAVRTQPTGDLTFTSYLSSVKTAVLGALENQDYPFDCVIKDCASPRNMGRHPVFDTMFIYQNIEMKTDAGGELKVSRRFIDPGISKYDLSLELYEEEQGFTCYLEYAKALFSDDAARDFGISFTMIVEFILAHPQTKIGQIPLLSPTVEKQRLIDFNATAAVYPDQASVFELFENNAKKTPDHVVVSDQGEEYTYAQVLCKANLIAGLLREMGAKGNIPIMIILEQGIDLITSILGVLHINAYYIPVDTNLPPERIRYMIADSGARLVLTSSDMESKLQLSDNLIVCSVNTVNRYEISSLEIRSHLSAPEDAAYVIYTSGSTGLPKGVIISNRSLVNYCWWAQQTYCNGQRNVFPLFTSISFDLTITSLFVPLISGGCIKIYNDTTKDLLIEQVIRDNKAEIIKLTPSHLKIILHSDICKQPGYKSRLKVLVVGGEELPAQLCAGIMDLLGPDIKIYNEYGPTEATVGCMIHLYNRQKDNGNVVPIGKPISNTSIYLLDKGLRPVAGQTIGEIYIAGDGVAQGYLNQEEMTAQRFLPDLYSSDKRMYKTGDLGRWNKDRLDFFGRADRQVKIRGYRIELSEIESQLMLHEGVKETIVIINNDSDSARLIAYVVLHSGWEAGVDLHIRLRAFLLSSMPLYMVPSQFIFLKTIPLTHNGKIELQGLPAFGLTTESTHSVPSGNKVQTIMIKAWKELLNAEVGIYDNFFELGGDSIKAVQLVSRLTKDNIHVSVKDILQYQTIADISLHIKKTDITNGYEQGIFIAERPFTPIEKWFFEQQQPLPNHYLQSVLLTCKEHMQADLLQQTIDFLFSQHDGLRQQYNPETETVKYADLSDVFTQLQEIVLSTCENPAADEVQLILQQVSKSLHISNGPLIRIVLLHLKQQDYLFLCAHHLVVDGVSWRILLGDLYQTYMALIQGKELPVLYKTASMKNWVNALYEKAESLELPSVFRQELEVSRALPIVPEVSFAIEKYASVQLIIEKQNLNILQEKARINYKTDIEGVIMTAWLRALTSWMGQDQFLVEMEHHGRTIVDENVSRTVGWFTSIYPVYFQLPNLSIGDQLIRVKEQLNSIPNNGAAYGIFRYLKQHGINEWPKARIRFNYLGNFEEDIDNDLFFYCDKQSNYNIAADNFSTVLLELNCMVVEGNLKIEVQYNTMLWNPEDIQRLSGIIEQSFYQLKEHLQEEQEIHFSPSDFSLADLDKDDLDKLFQ